MESYFQHQIETSINDGGIALEFLGTTCSQGVEERCDQQN